MAKLADTITGARVLGARFAASQRRANPEGRMPLMDHIRELRNRLLKALAAVAAGMAIGFIPQVYDRIWAFIYHPFKMAAGHDHLIVIGVFDGFMLRVQIAFFFGLIVTSPLWLYQIWAFIAPGLYRREKRWTYMFVGVAAPLFAAGAALAYFAMSRGLHYLLALVPNGVSVMATVTNYLSYFEAMILGFGLAFELPLALVMLNMVGILSHERIAKWRRIIIFSVFVFAGIASPSPDPLTMLLLALPCVALVEVADLLIWMNDRRRASRPSMYAGLSDDEVSPMDFDTVSRDGADAGRGPGSGA
ncbi:MAG TPA: twin-arginine translocase subunit TatC [Streptosporangiaceae bacterium]|nr:twin-arginine translocase subunit TatC [Streptosporangiaceae bacterium]